MSEWVLLSMGSGRWTLGPQLVLQLEGVIEFSEVAALLKEVCQWWGALRAYWLTPFPVLLLPASCVGLRCGLSASCSCHHVFPTIMDIQHPKTLSQNKLFLIVFLVMLFYYSNRKENDRPLNRELCSFSWEMGTNSIHPQIGQQELNKETILPKSLLVNQWACWSHLQEHEWRMTYERIVIQRQPHHYKIYANTECTPAAPCPTCKQCSWRAFTFQQVRA